MWKTASTFVRLTGAAVFLVGIVLGLVWLVNGTTRAPVSGGSLTATPEPALTPDATLTPAAQPTLDRAGSLSLAEAEKLVREGIFTSNPSMNPAAQFPLVEVTPDEVWQRTKAQLFRVTEGVQVNETYLIWQGRVNRLGTSFGGTGVREVLVTDLDSNGEPELIFPCQFGSGISQTTIGMVLFEGQDPLVFMPQETNRQADLRLQKQSDQRVLVEQRPFTGGDWTAAGLLKLVDQKLFITPDSEDLATYTSPEWGLFFQYPSNWQAEAASGGVRYSGADGFFSLSPLPYSALDLMQACELLGNSDPARYGEEVRLMRTSLDQSREGCVIRSSANSPDAQSALLFSSDSGAVLLLAVDPPHLDVIGQTLRFSAPLPTATPEPLDLKAQAGAQAGKLETRALGDLSLSEFAVIEAGKDFPSHFEYNQRIPADLYPERANWYEQSAEQRLAQANQALAAFGWRLEAAPSADGSQRFSLYQGEKRVKEGVTMYFPPAIYRDEQGNGDFALVVEDAQAQDWLARKNGLETWDLMLHRGTRPVFDSAGNLITVERGTPDYTLEGDALLVKQAETVIYRYALAASPVSEPVKKLDAWNGGWVLEVDGALIVNGAIYNLKDFPAEEIFNWTYLNGKPFFFFRKDGKIGAWYAGQVLPVQWDEVIHDRCCEPAAFNVLTTPNAVWFHARRSGMWYFVQIK